MKELDGNVIFGYLILEGISANCSFIIIQKFYMNEQKKYKKCQVDSLYFQNSVNILH